MTKLLIADDEPLVLVGMQSMLDWNALGVELCAVAHNGQQAMTLIEQHHPDVVITDIKMPLMSGLELAQKCRESYGDIPVFIMLTSFEEFSFVREAMHHGAVEYLIKLELTPETLRSAVEKAQEQIRRLRGSEKQQDTESAQDGSAACLGLFRDRFFARLYNNLFESGEQLRQQAQNLSLTFDSYAYAVAACEIGNVRDMPLDKQLTLCTSTAKMVCEALEKFMPCNVTMMDMRHFHILFCMSEEQAGDGQLLPRLLRLASDTVQRYFSVQLLCGLGTTVRSVSALADSSHYARCALAKADAAVPIRLTGEQELSESAFEFANYRPELTKAFEELDAGALYDAITAIVERLDGHPSRHVQARDSAFCLLYLARTLLPDGEATLEEIYSDAEDGYLALYRYTGTAQCCEWMRRLRDGLYEKLNSEHRNYKSRLVENVTEYIRQNLDRRLTLNEVAAAFNFSPNYLSQLFARYAERGFVETITHEKIALARTLLSEGSWKIYEIAEKLGYESAFYFSKVFKKETGMSPREYMNQVKR